MFLLLRATGGGSTKLGIDKGIGVQSVGGLGVIPDHIEGDARKLM